ncbi:MAG TPA: AAA family ATPase [Terracidiphilus sp.]|nr:AAA family ATPase [Terracidiphilus sp.]
MKQFDSFRLDTSNECLWQSGAQIALPPKPFAILRYLVENPGRLITHDELLDALWPETYVQPQVLRTYMLELRKVLGDDAAAPRFIQTLPKRGYCFVAPVVEGGEIRTPQSSAAVSHHPKPAALPDPIVDREPEMERLLSLEELAAAGQRQVVFITGGAGIGKTALVDAFASVAGSGAAIVVRGQCVEAIGRKEQYYPVMEALSQLCASPEGERACRILARMAPQWLPASGREPDSMAAGAPRSTEVRLPGELCGALEELASDKPLIFVFEDLHWADESTLGLISALARRRTPAKLMLVVTYRAQDGSADQSLKALKQDLLIRRLGVELPLEPLNRQAVRELLRRELGQASLPPGLDGFVFQRSEGNPLFVIALLRHLIAQEYLGREHAGGGTEWKQRAPFPEVETGVPDELLQMIELEVERLSPADQRLLEAASLINVAFPAWAVAAALEEDAAEIEEVCDDLARRLYFVRRAGEDELPDGSRSAFYVFSHGLYREVLYQRQSASRRARRHTRIAERLGQLFAGREASVAQEMALHFEAAGNWQRAAGALRSAARHAWQRRANSEAAALLEHALKVAENLGEVDRGAILPEMHAELAQVRQSIRA